MHADFSDLLIFSFYLINTRVIPNVYFRLFLCKMENNRLDGD